MPCSVEYGTTPSFGSSIGPTDAGKRHEIKLTGLSANTKYYYRLFNADEPLTDTLTFATTKDDSDGAFSFVVFGDCGTGGERQREIADQILRVNPDFGLIAGDIIYPKGARKDYDTNYFFPYRDIISSICLFPAMGNHDYYSEDGKPYLDTFVLPANNPAHSEKYYSFDYGNAHFVCLDSDLKIGEEEEAQQFEWVKDDLSSTKKLWKFVFFHHPPYSSSRHGSEVSIRKRYCPIFGEDSVDIVFCGHDHDYERTVKIKNILPDGNGVIYIVTGGGGARLYRAGRHEWTAFSKKIHHFVNVRIDERTLTLSAIDHRGKVFDELVLNKDASGPR